jgi:hypothetical protein
METGKDAISITSMCKRWRMGNPLILKEAAMESILVKWLLCAGLASVLLLTLPLLPPYRN